ncbi:mucin-2-like [Planococcus citri]|uniref:mucin-2-like n=1 Tax=Planococcus citri TaxID=170843 RepID=UPI0031F97914
MDRCEAPNCKMRTYAPTVEQMKMAKNNYIISFHKFPDDPYRRQSWIDAAKKPSWKPPMFNSSLCSLHFCNNCFDENNDLHDHAVPSIFFDDFGSHMREVVKKLDMECKLDDDDFSKPGLSSNTRNCNIKSNIRSTIQTTDRVDASVVHCEEVVECDESPKKLGIENISIPELDETMSLSWKNNNINPRVCVPVLDVSNNIVDIEIVNSSSGSISKSNHDDDAVSAKRIKIEKDSDKLKATLCDTLSKDTSISLSKMSTSVTVTSSPPAATPAKLNVPQSTTSVTSKPTATSSVSAASNSSALVRGNCNTSGFSVMEPTTKNLVIQLLNIVKMANASDENRVKSGPTLNSYLVTSKCPDTDASDLCEVLPSASVILNVANYVKEIKEESFVKPDNVNIICGSPAIFLLKNITVQECDPNMNCVYVITSENLLPHLYKMKLKSGVSTKSTSLQSTTASSAAEMIIQKPLQVADLVSSANPKTVLPIQKRLCGSSDTTNPISTPKRESNLSNSANKPASNSVACAGPKPRPLDSISTLDAFVSAGVPPTIISGKVVSVSGKVVLKPQTSGLISHSPATQPPVKDTVSSTPLVKIPRIDLRSSNSTTLPTNISTSEIPSVTLPVSTAKTVVSNSSICYNYLTKGTANVSISNSTPAKPTTTASVSHSVTITPVKPTNSLLKSPLVVSSSVTLAKPSVHTSISSPRGTFVKPTTNPLKIPSVTITTPVVKPTFSTTPILQAIPATPNTALARIALPLPKSTVSTPPVVQLGVQSDSINVSKTQPSIIIRGKDGALARIPSNTVRAQVLTNASSTLVHANGSPTSSIRCHQPTLNGAIVAKSYTQSPSKTQLPSSLTFRSIQSTSFDTNLKPSEVLITYDSFTSTLKQSTSLPPDTKQTIPTIPVPNQLTVIPPLKRKWDEIDDSEDDDDDDNDPFFANCNDEEYDKEYVELQRKRISKCEANILQKEREINGLKKKIQSLKKRLNSVKDPRDTKTDEQLAEEILSKYIDSDGIQFFIGQMKIAGKTYTQFRWSEDDKLFALGLLYRNPVEYNVLFQKYTLPSDKTLNKFVNRVKKSEMEDDKGSFSRI